MKRSRPTPVVAETAQVNEKFRDIVLQKVIDGDESEVLGAQPLTP